MPDASDQTNLPAQIGSALSGIPKALIPNSVKALDRLVGALIDFPGAWLAQQTAKIEAQTASYILVEKAIADAAARVAGGDVKTVQNALNVLVRKAYRQQTNKQAIAAAMVEDLRVASEQNEQEAAPTPPPGLDEDWLNVFERYAEDASTERMQKLWGRVLAGEIRKPGRYSMRTLRFLSEFSQADALTFAEFGASSFKDQAPAVLVKPPDKKDIRDLLSLESSGLIQGTSGLGLNSSLTFDAKGHTGLQEGSLCILLQGDPGQSFTYPMCVLTPLGQELLSLLPGRDPRAAARRVANAIRVPAVKSAALATVVEQGQIRLMEILWQPEPEDAVKPVV